MVQKDLHVKVEMPESMYDQIVVDFLAANPGVRVDNADVAHWIRVAVRKRLRKHRRKQAKAMQAKCRCVSCGVAVAIESVAQAEWDHQDDMCVKCLECVIDEMDEQTVSQVVLGEEYDE